MIWPKGQGISCKHSSVCVLGLFVLALELEQSLSDTLAKLWKLDKYL